MVTIEVDADSSDVLICSGVVLDCHQHMVNVKFLIVQRSSCQVSVCRSAFASDHDCVVPVNWSVLARL